MSVISIPTLFILTFCPFSGSSVQCHIPSDRGTLHEAAHETALRGQPDGRTYTQGYHTVLRLRTRKTEGLSNYIFEGGGTVGKIIV